VGEGGRAAAKGTPFVILGVALSTFWLYLPLPNEAERGSESERVNPNTDCFKAVAACS